jgi:glycosyltransferase involved in cell wall biosynthesis
MLSVIVPAHNEEAVIESSLRAMTESAGEGELEIIVVANGCTDRTAEIARNCGPYVRVIETEVASKIHALRLGDEVAGGFPRYYVDADVILPLESIRRVRVALQEEGCLAAAPTMRVDLTGSSWAVRAYYDIWMSLPYHKSGMIGSGVYAMSRAGRERFDVFPDIISDDGFARLMFSSEERMTVEDASFVISAPKKLSGVLKIKTRSQKGAVQLKRLFPELLKNDVRDYQSSFIDIFRTPGRWPKAAVYLYVSAYTKLRAYWMNYVGGLGDWERDDTSRASTGRPVVRTEPRSGLE